MKNKKIDQMWCELNSKTDEKWDSLPYSLTSIAEAFKVPEMKFPKDSTSIKMPHIFQGVTIEMPVASKILRSKLNLEDDIEIRIV